MKVFKGEDLAAGGESSKRLAGGSAVTIGNFDGVHIGHQTILHRVKERARSLLVPAVVLTFDPHPRKVLSAGEGIHLLTDRRHKCILLDNYGMDFLIILKFDREFATQSPVEFIENWLTKLRPKAVIVGYDFNFGRGGSGTLDILRQEGKIRGFDVEVVEATRVDGMVVSSSRIRNLVEAGEVTKAIDLLGRPYSVSGHVIKGHGRGRKLGFPTANVDATAEVLPADGVYAGETLVDSKPYPAMINIGSNPTFDDIARSLEACILNFNRDIYGKELEVRFLERIRSEVKFKGPEELIAQIRRDQALIEEYFRERASNGPGRQGV